jgi:4-diphosphocytidyl-2-C-methyl-D-erythritol kinase
VAPAKINLWLDVGALRQDGYHEIETVFLALPWGDRLDVEMEIGAEPGITLRASGDVAVPAGEANLAWRAAHRYAEEAGRAGRPLAGGVRLDLVKEIPTGAGLGGGSSDAAAVLRGLSRLVGSVPDPALELIAGELGADVPFLLHADRTRAAVARGRGDVLEPLPPPPALDVLLILPPLSNETARVYAAAPSPRTSCRRGGLEEVVAALAAGDPRRLRAAHANALAGGARTAYPAFARFADEVERRLGRPPAMTGSGAALYDLPDPGEGTKLLDRLDGLAGRRLLLRG